MTQKIILNPINFQVFFSIYFHSLQKENSTLSVKISLEIPDSKKDNNKQRGVSSLIIYTERISNTIQRYSLG